MSAALIAAHKLQADTAGLTKAAEHRIQSLHYPGATAPEAISHLIHGESGGLHYLWSDLIPTPVAESLPQTLNNGPNRGAGHPDVTGQPVMRPMALPPGPAAVPYEYPHIAEGIPRGEEGLVGIYA